MTHVGSAPLSSTSVAAGRSFIEWGAVLAGAFWLQTRRLSF
jgi:hypothetical protein